MFRNIKQLVAKARRNITSGYAKAGILVGGAIAASSANAAIDLTAVETALADLPTVITTIGSALISAAALAVAFKWAKGALFG